MLGLRGIFLLHFCCCLPTLILGQETTLLNYETSSKLRDNLLALGWKNLTFVYTDVSRLTELIKICSRSDIAASTMELNSAYGQLEMVMEGKVAVLGESPETIGFVKTLLEMRSVTLKLIQPFQNALCSVFQEDALQNAFDRQQSGGELIRGHL